MAKLQEQLIEEIRSKADIVEVIGQYLPLTKKGRNYAAVCPFHDDHDPSLSISTDKQIYKCFVCNAGGNVFTFVQQYEQLGFLDAVRKVGEICHIDVPLQSSQKEVMVNPKKRVWHKVLNDTISFASYQLQTADGKDALDYLRQRDMDEALIQTFQLGYLPFGGSKLYQFLHAKGYSDEDIVSSGVCRVTERGMVDIFEGRILFPIHDGEGNPIAFSARIMPKDQNEARPKYINSFQSELYEKSQVLYNAHRAKNSSRQEKLMYIVEGPLDVIALYRVQVYNVVATMGTAFTKEQVQQLRKLAPHQVLCYDGDQAGQNANYKAGQLLKQMNVSFGIVRNSLKLDPDEIIKQYGKEELKVMLETPQTWIEFLFTYYATKFNLSNYSDNKEFANLMMQEIVQFEAFDAQVYKERLSQLTGFTSFQLDQLKPQIHVHKTTTAGKTKGVTKRTKIELAQLEILAQMLHFKEAALLFERQLGFLIQDQMKDLALYLVSYYRTHEEMDVSQLVTMLHEEEDLCELIFEVEENERLVKQWNPDALQQACNTVIAYEYDRKIEALKQEANRIQDPAKKAELLLAVIDLKQKKGAMQ